MLKFQGAVKITPSHDPADFEMAKRHGLSHLNILSDDGTLVNVPPQFMVAFHCLFPFNFDVALFNSHVEKDCGKRSTPDSKILSRDRESLQSDEFYFLMICL